jgi:large subunit ribosomal protein L6
MSKLARKPIDLSDVNVSMESTTLIVKGKHGSMSLNVPPVVTVSLSPSELYVASSNPAHLGLYFSLIRNMVHGVKHLFLETLVLKGVGYRAALADKKITLNLGYSHPVVFTIPDGISAEIPTQTEIKLTGVDKQLVGQVAADIIKLRPAKKDPYKEKGIKRTRDRILKKVGKKVK